MQLKDNALGESFPMKAVEWDGKCSSEKDKVEQKCQRQILACSFPHSVNQKCCGECVKKQVRESKGVHQLMKHISQMKKIERF